MPFLAILAAAPLALCSAPVVHDGDTIRCGAERVRIANIDAPELPGSPKCRHPRRYDWCDYERGYAARDALAGLVADALARGRPVTLLRNGVDRYGRTLALVSVDGVDAGEFLIRQRLARRWR